MITGVSEKIRKLNIGYLQYVVDRGDSKYGSGDQLSSGKYDGTNIYFDCWGLGESIIATGGEIVYNRDVTLDPYSLYDTSVIPRGNIHGDTVKQSSQLSSDFTSIEPGEWLFYEESGYCTHVGYYIGNGKLIEIYGGGKAAVGTLYPDGSGSISSPWAKHGKVPWIDYSAVTYTVKAEYHCDLTVTLTKNPDTNVVEVWSMPGSNSTYPESTTIDTLSSGTKVHATQIIQNAVTSSAHYWYKISYGSGKTGYIFTNYTKNPTQNWSVSASDVTKPGNLSIGDSFTMRGTVSTGGSKITKLQGFIYPGETTSGTAEQSSNAVYPNNTEASISSIDSSLYFNNITSAGTYTYTVKVDLSSYTMANGAPKEETKSSVVVGDVTTKYTVGDNSPKGGSGEYAIFPGYTMYVNCIAYEQENGNGTGAQHGSQNAIDILPYRNVFAPFTGRIAYVDANWGYVTLQSLERVYWADGSYDYMTVGFMHDSDISNLYVGKEISQGTDFYQAGGMGDGNPDAYGAHVHITVLSFRKKQTIRNCNYSKKLRT